MSKELLAPLFSRHLNSRFRSTLAGRNTTDFKLVAVENRPSPEGYECFTVRFQAPMETPTEQGTYRLEHEEVPSMDIFMVPTAKDEDGVLFEAVFNRLLVPRSQGS